MCILCVPMCVTELKPKTAFFFLPFLSLSFIFFCFTFSMAMVMVPRAKERRKERKRKRGNKFRTRRVTEQWRVLTLQIWSAKLCNIWYASIFSSSFPPCNVPFKMFRSSNFISLVCLEGHARLSLTLCTKSQRSFACWAWASTPSQTVRVVWGSSIFYNSTQSFLSLSLSSKNSSLLLQAFILLVCTVLLGLPVALLFRFFIQFWLVGPRREWEREDIFSCKRSASVDTLVPERTLLQTYLLLWLSTCPFVHCCTKRSNNKKYSIEGPSSSDQGMFFLCCFPWNKIEGENEKERKISSKCFFTEPTTKLRARSASLTFCVEVKP